MSLGTVDEVTAIADSAAIALGGPILITDERFDVLAYSRSGDDTGGLRARSILARRLPRELVAWLGSSGTAALIRTASAPLTVEPPGGGLQVVSPIRWGADLVGIVWLALPRQRVDGTTIAVLGDTSLRAAGAVLRRRLGDSADASAAEDTLSHVLAGRGDASTLAPRLGADAEGVRLIGFDLCEPRALSATEARMLETITGLCVEGPKLGLATMSGSRIYALVRDTGAAAARELASLVLARIERGTGIECRAVVSDALAELTGLAQVRARTDRCLDTPQWESGTPIRSLADAGGEEVLDHVAEIFESRPELLHQGVLSLAASDSRGRSDYVHTLKVYFDCNCDLAAASRVLFVHRNTLKYRLGRICDIAGIDLTRPAERLMVELQVRFLIDRRRENRPARAIGETA